MKCQISNLRVTTVTAHGNLTIGTYTLVKSILLKVILSSLVHSASCNPVDYLPMFYFIEPQYAIVSLSNLLPLKK